MAFLLANVSSANRSQVDLRVSVSRRQFLVTGASGFVGQVLCRQLKADCLDQNVVGVVRSGVCESCDESVSIDLRGTFDLSDYLNQTDTVFHLAGVAHRQASTSEYEKVNFAQF